MKSHEHGACRELFEFVSDGRTRWAFVVLPDDGWAITRNGQRVAVGAAGRGSIRAGVKKCATFTHGLAGASQGDLMVHERLDRIQAQILRTRDGRSRTSTPTAP
jgi:hypothetical protein